MICIFSRTQDATTTEVLRWLKYIGVAEVIRINSDVSGKVSHLHIDTDRLSFQYADRQIQLSDLKAVWYRKGRHWLCNDISAVTLRGHEVLAGHLRRKIEHERLRLSEYIHYLIDKVTPMLGSSVKSDLNKLMILNDAMNVGLSIPSFHISNSKSILVEAARHRESITKAIGDGIYFFDNERTNTGYFSYTEELDLEASRHWPDEISPSLLQHKIVKRYDVRVFYLDGRFYSMAIFSQRDKQTSVDFRRYNATKPNRTIPISLKPDIEEKLRRLFAMQNLNTGSVDFVVDQNGQYFFLEINPVGQFGGVSRKCNYYLEKEIAITLRDYAKRRDE